MHGSGGVAGSGPLPWIVMVVGVTVMTLFVGFVGLWTAAPDTAPSSRWAWPHAHQISLVWAVRVKGQKVCPESRIFTD
mgnify:CR=1 FL=1